MSSIIFNKESNEYKTIESILSKIATSSNINSVAAVCIEASEDKAVIQFKIASNLSPANPGVNVEPNSKKDRRVIRPADASAALEEDLELRGQLNEDWNDEPFYDELEGISGKGPFKQASELDSDTRFKTVTVNAIIRDAINLSEVYDSEQDDYFIDETVQPDSYKDQFLTQLREDLDDLIDVDTMSANCLVDYKIDGIEEQGNSISIDGHNNEDKVFSAQVAMILDIPINGSTDIKQAVDEECANIQEILRDKYDVTINGMTI